MHPSIYRLMETITAEDEASRPPRPPKESTLGLKVWSPAKKPEYGVPKIWGTFQGFLPIKDYNILAPVWRFPSEWSLKTFEDSMALSCRQGSLLWRHQLFMLPVPCVALAMLWQAEVRELAGAGALSSSSCRLMSICC